MNYEKKYLKYKNKYLQLKKQTGRGEPVANPGVDSIEKVNTFSVVTFNTELELELFYWFNTQTGQTYLNLPREEIQNKANWRLVRDEEKYGDYIELFKKMDPNVICCMQETVMPNPFTRLGPLGLVAESRSHLLEWLKSNAIHNPDGTAPAYLANAIYASDSLAGGHGSSRDMHSLGGRQRSFALYRTQINEQCPVSLLIATGHFSGGREDDELIIRAILDGTYVNYKLIQAREMIASGAHVITGDFNAKYRDTNYPELLAGMNSHRDSILRSLGSPVFTQEQQAQWEDWMGMDSIHALMLESGYMSAYEPGEIKDTNSFRGACDVIYYNPSVVTQVGRAEILNDPVVMEVSSLKPRLSDHFPVHAHFVFRV